MQVLPYLGFDGRCEEAIEFYKSAVGAKVESLMRFKESPDCPPSGKFPPEMLEKVMHSSLKIGKSTVMATDGHCKGKPNFSGISLTLSVTSADDAERYFAALGEGGKVTMPMAKTFFSSRFGMLTDRFGVPWMVVVQA
jgi:PhnB protein